ncbi:MAG TPA: DUF1553 domain-containing protein [Gemmataceae bacterium]|jgi:hypothetical protein|nr:DUF1553 domain-containing protein [Gemmataceae bacterium]
MQSLSRFGCAIVVAAIIATTVVGQSAVPDFDAVVAPILADRCIICHGGVKPKGKLDLTRKAGAFAGKRGPVVVAKSLAESSLWQRVEAGEMPPKKPLPAAEKAILKSWIESGAAWGRDPIDPFRMTTTRRAGFDWWSLQPVRCPPLPVVKRSSWVRNSIDRFVLAKLEAEGLAPSPEADARTLLRRLHYGLTGLPATSDEAAAFLAASKTADADKALGDCIQRLLASPAYGETWARHWLDVVRFGESNGFEHDELRKNAWPYRDWVIKAFNNDMPYDEFARLQIAGDVLAADESGAIATGFMSAGGFDTVGQEQQSAAMRAVVRQDELEDIVGTIGQTFLGLTVQCARCHDHKFDPVRTEEYYRLTAAVAGVRHGEREVASAASRLAYEIEQTRRRKRIEQIRSELAAIDEPVHKRIRAERAKSEPSAARPRPSARWDFTKSLVDEIAGIHADVHGDARRDEYGLHLGGTGFAASTPLPRPIAAKTLTAEVILRDLSQRGGAAISLESPDGSLFDAIVFGERQPGHWMAGSDSFRRTKDWTGPPETDADKTVHLAIVYSEDGTIAGYRNGIPLGAPYKSEGPIRFDAGKAMLLFGLRHSPSTPGRHLVGTLLRAELFDRALGPSEIAASAAGRADFVLESDIVAKLDDAARIRRKMLKSALDQTLAAVAAPPPFQRVYAVAPKAPEPTHLLVRGSLGQLGPLVTPGGVASLGPEADFKLDGKSTDAERRRALADWIASPKNPLFARVMVNRLWQHHFGIGLVDTPSDFGFNGGRPSHPALLDWLADEFIRSGYSIKHMQRLIVGSATYRQASAHRAAAAQRDADDRWLWRKAPVRLEAEAVRDSMLFVAGQLNDARGGPGYQDFKVVLRNATYSYTPIDRDDPAVQRRSIYRTWTRGGRSPLLDVLDCPDPSTVAPRRMVTTTPLQALALLNNGFVLRMADRFADRLKKEAGSDPTRQIDTAYRLALGRPPTADEIETALPVVRTHGLSVLCRAIFNSNEFLYVD